MATIESIVINIKIRVPDEYDADVWPLLENLRISCENACDAAVKELGLPDRGLEATVL